MLYIYICNNCSYVHIVLGQMIEGDVKISSRLEPRRPKVTNNVNSVLSPWLQEIRGKWVSITIKFKIKT